jgi:hypothetical protein
MRNSPHIFGIAPASAVKATTISPINTTVQNNNVTAIEIAEDVIDKILEEVVENKEQNFNSI